MSRPPAKSSPARLQEASRNPVVVMLATDLMTISCVAESIFTVSVSVRAVSLTVMVASGTPVPPSVPTIQFDDCRVCPATKLLIEANCPVLGFFK